MGSYNVSEAVWQYISNILQELILAAQFGSYFRQLQEVFRNPYKRRKCSKQESNLIDVHSAKFNSRPVILYRHITDFLSVRSSN